MKYFLIMIFLFPLIAQAQFTDDFSDGDFTNNPTWSGDTAKFEVDGNNQLHLNAPAITETAYLSTPSEAIENATWEFFVKLDFNPSSSNYARVYLVANQPDLGQGLNGYFVEVGGTDDEVSLYRQDGTDDEKIIDGTDDLTDTDPVNVRVKVTRDDVGNWELLADTAGGTSFVSQGTVMDDTYFQTFYFGVFCDYTSTRSDLFYFDDFNVSGDAFIDSIAPEVTAVTIQSQTELDVQFSETVSAATAENTANYSVDNGYGNPASAILDGSDPTLVHLTYGTPFQNGLTNTLTVSNVEDLSGNAMQTSTHTFAYYIAQQFDLVFNEIMADPTPSVGLPEYEFVELYNRTNVPINIKNWTFTYGTTSKVLPDVSVPADSFLVLTVDDALPQFGSFIHITEVDGLSSTALTNGGQTIILRDSTGTLIHSVSYTDEWYQNSNKADGGWSLEMFDPSNPCGGKDNWIAAIDPLGGTPGRVNSVAVTNPDNTGPELVRVSVLDETTLVAYFNEPVDSLNATDINAYSVDNGLGNPNSAVPVSPQFTKVVLTLSQPLQPQTIYNLSVSNLLKDCVGNEAGVQGERFAIPETAEENDLIINEVLFNPVDDGVDFVELYNRSDKVLDLKSLRIANYDTILETVENSEEIDPRGFLVFPQEYYVLTESPETVKNQYFTDNPDGFVKVEDLPTFTNEADEVALSDSLGNIIDLFIYHEDMHFPLLNEVDGVSLERISPERPTDDDSNWHSAAEAVDFATPAYQNSQFSLSMVEESPITVEPEIFSPDNDGYNDVLNITYEFEQAGNVATITIYDSRGRLIKNLKENELLGTRGTFSWDGIDEKNGKARIGVYLVLVEIFDINGNTKKYKESFVLGGKL